MQQPVTIQCPYCFELVTIYLAHDDLGTMYYDCEVCCRPWTLQVWLNEYGEVQATASR